MIQDQLTFQSFPCHLGITGPVTKSSWSPLVAQDPDCILLGESTKLTDAEVVSAASIVAMTGGMFLLSDDMEKVSEARLSVAKRIFPLTGVTAVPLDLHSTINGGMPSMLRLWCTESSQKDGDMAAKEIDIISPLKHLRT